MSRRGRIRILYEGISVMRTFICDVDGGKKRLNEFKTFVRRYISAFNSLTIRWSTRSVFIAEVFNPDKDPIIEIDLSLPLGLQMYQLGYGIKKYEKELGL